ncbi:amyotrophic lateral sclerosis 2 chromosomal region candidate gene 12 protein isoform X2 [Nannospalax galili]|uniref:Flagellum associated containing coiled-coil domains 1 n=1 Tax=Nannospalax galili TaxID=1026970 RepID=A0A8C6W1N3_NANGA|nr:amyotrophic lateral sclerosis 2 chromosomal region candidate gene 12 protein isoform X2 [Nannospalax galili]
MYPNPLIYCTCWDPWNLGPRKLIKTPHQLPKTSTGKSKLTLPAAALKDQNHLLTQPTKPTVSPKEKVHLRNQEEGSKLLHEVINMSPGYQLIQNQEQISVTLGDEMFNRKKQLESDILNKVMFSRTDIISDLEEQISELTSIIEQMNRDHQSAQKLLSNEMDVRCAEMKENFENINRELKKTHKVELGQLENSYKEALKAEKAAAQEKLEEMGKKYKYLKNMFHIYQDSIYDEMEDKWARRKAEWEKDKKLERERILLQQKHKMTKKFELESEEEKRKINESYSAVFENFIREKEDLMKQHENDMLQIQELKRTKEILEEELHAQAIILESLNTNLYHNQLELQREKALVGSLEKMFQIKLAEAEEKYKYTIQLLTEENINLRQKMNASNEETCEERSEKSTSVTPGLYESGISGHSSNKRQAL